MVTAVQLSLVLAGVFAACIVLALGYLLGRLHGAVLALGSAQSRVPEGPPAAALPTAGLLQPRVRPGEETRSRPDVTIDERKFVTRIDTAGMTRSSGPLGTTTETKDDMSGSVSRLAQLKGQ